MAWATGQLTGPQLKNNCPLNPLQYFAASKQRSQPTEEIAEDTPLPFAALSIIYAVLGIAVYVAPHSVSLADVAGQEFSVDEYAQMIYVNVR